MRGDGTGLRPDRASASRFGCERCASEGATPPAQEAAAGARADARGRGRRGPPSRVGQDRAADDGRTSPRARQAPFHQLGDAGRQDSRRIPRAGKGAVPPDVPTPPSGGRGFRPSYRQGVGHPWRASLSSSKACMRGALGCRTTAAARWCPGSGVDTPQGFVQGSSRDPAGSSPNLPILTRGPCEFSPVSLEAALGQGYAMSCVVTNCHRPFGSM